MSADRPQSTYFAGGLVTGPAPNLLPGGGYQPRDSGRPAGEPPHQGTSGRKPPEIVVNVTIEGAKPLPAEFAARLRDMMRRAMVNAAQ